jgi:hypothetical protein
MGRFSGYLISETLDVKPSLKPVKLISDQFRRNGTDSSESLRCGSEGGKARWSVSVISCCPLFAESLSVQKGRS